MTEALIKEKGMPLEQAVSIVREKLPRDAVLVGQSVHGDIGWLGLKEGSDFAKSIAESCQLLKACS